MDSNQVVEINGSKEVEVRQNEFLELIDLELALVGGGVGEVIIS